jgi:hypothetical protein
MSKGPIHQEDITISKLNSAACLKDQTHDQMGFGLST